MGHLGFAKNLFDGQTGKTRNVLKLLQTKSVDFERVNYFDTQELRSSKLSLFKMINKLIKCNVLVYLPERNNLKYLFPFIYIICKLKGIKIVYLVVGGWLDNYLHSKQIYITMLSKIAGIFTESNQLTNNLKDHHNLQNVLTFPNFRMHNFSPSFKQNADAFKIVYMARIFKEKGIDVVFRLADHIQKKLGIEHSISIDFYGPIQSDEESYFKNELEKYNFVSYKSVLEPDQIYEILEQYDLLVLPSRYSNEGFPGTIMDAYISGIPVIISNWMFMPEYVDNGSSGYIFDLNKEGDFYSLIDNLYNDRTQLLKMKHSAYEKSKEYSSEVAWQILKTYLVS